MTCMIVERECNGKKWEATKASASELDGWKVLLNSLKCRAGHDEE